MNLPKYNLWYKSKNKNWWLRTWKISFETYLNCTFYNLIAYEIKETKFRRYPVNEFEDVLFLNAKNSQNWPYLQTVAYNFFIHLLKMGGRKSKFLSRFNIAQLNGLMSNACQQYNRLMLGLGDIKHLSNGASVYFAKAKLF